jgi:hypothetical protein
MNYNVNLNSIKQEKNDTKNYNENEDMFLLLNKITILNNKINFLKNISKINIKENLNQLLNNLDNSINIIDQTVIQNGIIIRNKNNNNNKNNIILEYI